MPKMKLSCRDWSEWVWFVMKTKQYNDMTDRISLVQAKNSTELSRPIWLGVIYDEN